MATARDGLRPCFNSSTVLQVIKFETFSVPSQEPAINSFPLELTESDVTPLINSRRFVVFALSTPPFLSHCQGTTASTMLAHLLLTTCALSATHRFDVVRGGGIDKIVLAHKSKCNGVLFIVIFAR